MSVSTIKIGYVLSSCQAPN